MPAENESGAPTARGAPVARLTPQSLPEDREPRDGALDGGTDQVLCAHQDQALPGAGGGGVEQLPRQDPRVCTREQEGHHVELGTLALVDGHRVHRVHRGQPCGADRQDRVATAIRASIDRTAPFTTTPTSPLKRSSESSFSVTMSGRPRIQTVSRGEPLDLRLEPAFDVARPGPHASGPAPVGTEETEPLEGVEGHFGVTALRCFDHPRVRYRPRSRGSPRAVRLSPDPTDRAPASPRSSLRTRARPSGVRVTRLDRPGESGDRSLVAAHMAKEHHPFSYGRPRRGSARPERDNRSSPRVAS